MRLCLVTDYRDTTRTYSEHVCKLTDLLCLGLQEVTLLRCSCRTAWDAAENARLALARHEADHGCDRADYSAPLHVTAG